MEKRYTFLSKNWLRFGLVAAFAVSSLNSEAQTAPAKVWDKTFGGIGLDLLTSMQETSDGGYILGGYSNTHMNGDKSEICKGLYDYWVIKLNAKGEKQWDKTFGGGSNDYLYSLKHTADGGYILGGGTDSDSIGDKTQNSWGNRDYWVVKLDAGGNKVWDKAFGGTEFDELICLQQTSDGGFILGGNSNSSVSSDKSQNCRGNMDFWIIKLNANGNKVWDKTIGSDDIDNLNFLQQTLDGGYILGGLSKSGVNYEKSQTNRGKEDYWVVKLDSNGNKLWDRTFGGNETDRLHILQETASGDYILCGDSKSGINGDKSNASQGSYDYWILKLNASGSKIWDKSFGGSGVDIPVSIHCTVDGNYIIGGSSNSGASIDKSQSSNGMYDFWILKLGPSGNKLWDKTLGGSNNEEMSSMISTLDGGYIIGGGSDSGISGDKSQASHQGSYDYWLVKIGGNPLGINSLQIDYAISISPNPSQGKFKLQLNDISAPKVEVSVSDLLGRVILQKEVQVTNKQLSEELDTKAAKGMYLLQVKASNQTTSCKIVVE